jgi:hypothetical protein
MGDMADEHLDRQFVPLDTDEACSFCGADLPPLNGVEESDFTYLCEDCQELARDEIRAEMRDEHYPIDTVSKDG